MKHINITVFGRVQGVGFRWSAMKKAGDFGLTGFVENKDNGTLYIEAEGEEENLTKFVTWCKKGPWLAKVDKVEITEGPLQHFSSFEIT